MVARAISGVAPHEGRIDTQIDGVRRITIERARSAEISCETRCSAQELPPGCARRAPYSERKKITDKSLGHTITHQCAKATSELVVFGPGASRILK